MVADSAMEGLVRFISQYRESAKQISQLIGAVLSQKLVRRLCDNCKLGFEPPPQLVEATWDPGLGVSRCFISPSFHRRSNSKWTRMVARHRLRLVMSAAAAVYFGRIAIFELLTPGDQLKATLKRPRILSQLAQVAKVGGTSRHPSRSCTDRRSRTNEPG